MGDFRISDLMCIYREEHWKTFKIIDIAMGFK